MNYATIKYCDIANGEGVRTSLFVSGCRRHCPNCFNAVAWDFNYGAPFTDAVKEQIIESLAPGYINGLSLLGGEPLEPENQPRVLEILRRVRRELPEKDIWCYSGFTFEELTGESRAHTEHIFEILSLLDVLVDGRYMKDRRNISLRFRGSENQRLLDVKKSLEENRAVIWDR